MCLFAESMEYIFVFRRWYVNEFLFRWQLRYFDDKINLVFVVFFHFFTVFCVFSLSFLSFVKSFNQIPTQRKQLRMFFFNFIVLLCLFFFCFQSVFFSFIFTLFFPALYNNLYTKTTLNVVTLGHSQETGDKKWKKTACIVVLWFTLRNQSHCRFFTSYIIKWNNPLCIQCSH